MTIIDQYRIYTDVPLLDPPECCPSIGRIPIHQRRITLFFLSSLKNHCQSGCCCCSCIYIYTHTTSIYPSVYMHTHRERERGMLLRVISPKHFSLTWTSQVYWLVCETLLSVNHSDLTRFIRLFFFFFLFFISNSARLFAMSRKGRRRFSLTLLSPILL